MKTDIRHIVCSALSLILLLSACSEEQDWTAGGQDAGYLQIEGEIMGSAGVADTRAAPGDLPMTFLSFKDNDRIGFFSFHDKNCDKKDRYAHRPYETNDDIDWLRNEELTYGMKKFTSTNIQDASLSKFGVTFAYFPYSSKKPDKYVKTDGQELNEAAEHYVHIFTDGTEAGGVHIVDLLTASKIQYFDVNYKFYHKFSLLLLFLGEGFKPEQEDNQTLKVHLTEKILGAHITRAWIDPPPYEQFTLSIDRVPKSEANEYDFGHITFTAPRIANYKLPEAAADTPERSVYPVILPAGTEIDYIEVTDKTGMLQIVKPTKEALPKLEEGWMYPLTITMTGVTPTIYPHEIVPWNPQEEIEIDRVPGIYTDEDFEEWIELYNKYAPDGFNKEKMNEDDAAKLDGYFGEYNDGTAEGSEGSWTFYLRDDIDCEGIVAEGGALINELPAGVTLDGGYRVLSNLMLDFEHQEESLKDNAVGLIGNINGGTLKNVRMEFVTVRNMNPNYPAGCLAGKISKGYVIDCTVREAAMMCSGVTKAGVLVGEMTNGIVDNCKFHGMVQAEPSTVEAQLKGIVGNRTGGSITGIINRVILTDRNEQSQTEKE